MLSHTSFHPILLCILSSVVAAIGCGPTQATHLPAGVSVSTTIQAMEERSTTAPPTPSPQSHLIPQDRVTFVVVPRDTWTMAVGEGFLWVTHGKNLVSRIGLTTYQPVGEPIELDSLSGRIITANGAAWVVASKSEEDVLDVRIWRIDPQTAVVKPIVAQRLNSNGNTIAVTGNTLWLTDPAELTGSRLWRYDLRNDPIEGKEFPIGLEPLALIEGAGSLWTANHDEGTVNRIDPATGKIIATIEVGYSLHGLSFDEGVVWTANWHNQTVSRVDAATNRVIGLPLQVGLPPTQMAAAQGTLWVGAHTSVREAVDDRVARIDTKSNRVVETFHDAGRIRDMTFAQGALWILTGEPDRVLRILP